MRRLLCASSSIVVLLGLVACGGATPPPKTDESSSSSAPAASDAGPAPAASNDTKPPAPDPTPAPAPAPAPPAEDEVWQAFHVMPTADVLTTMKGQPKVQTCIHDGLKRDSSSTGEVKIKFVVTQKGQVLAWRDEGSSMTDPDVTRCIGEVIKTLKFPAQKATDNSVGLYSINVSN